MSVVQVEPSSKRAPSAHFEFGKNWQRFLTKLDQQRIAAAADSLTALLGKSALSGQRFLDAGSGSGLFSLAAHRLGAEVVSIDIDPFSVACTEHVRNQFADNPSRWNIFSGSLLDRSFIQTLGTYDVVYCWGVAHHTGDMWRAIDHLIACTRIDGRLVLAIYNDQQYISRWWRIIKSLYQRLPRWLRPAYVAVIGSGLFLKRLFVTLLACCLRLVSLRKPWVPVYNWLAETQSRGMHAWFDLVDWVGGWPFEVAKPEEIFRYLRDRGFELQELVTCSGHGCNEFVFARRR